MRVAVANAPSGWSLGKAPAGVTVATSLARGLDLVLLFAVSQRDLNARWPKALAAVQPDGALWVASPKRSSGVATDLGMGQWAATRGSGWNPVSMIAIDETWSATRFKHAPGLDRARDQRQRETINDADGLVVVDRATRIVTAPADLQQLLARNAKARAAFDALSFTNRKEYVVWILDAKKPETRAARLTKTVALLSKGRKNPSGR